MLDLEDLYSQVLAAEQRLRPYIVETPVLTNDDANEMAQKKIYFKCENLQRTGVFKARGALNAVLAFLEEDPNLAGVVTHSSGNHGQALAWAAKLCGVPCTVVVPDGSLQSKIDLIKKRGANVVVSAPTPLASSSMCAKIAREEGKMIVEPYDEPLVIAGQGTIGLEMLRQVPELDLILVPVAGGGMISGISIAAAKGNPKTKVCAVEPVGKNLQPCLEAGQRLWPNPPQFIPTVAEGIRLQQIGHKTFPILCEYTAKKVFSVTDNEMIAAMKWSWENLKVVVEVSSAAGVAVVLSEEFKNYPAEHVGVVLCGGNCSLDKLMWP